jgi:hypothetical protein
MSNAMYYNRADYISEVIETANTIKQGDSLRMRATTWIASAMKWLYKQLLA